jgi:multisubunit Na+/H+ antiporter MnhB subunit
VTRWLVPAVGVVLVLIGALWTLQGTGVLGGSSMTGSKLWTINGLIAVFVGLGLVWLAVRVRRS